MFHIINLSESHIIATTQTDLLPKFYSVNEHILLFLLYPKFLRILDTIRMKLHTRKPISISLPIAILKAFQIDFKHKVHSIFFK